MNSNTQSLTQKLEISPRFCTPYDGSWLLASEEEIAKAVSLKAEYRQKVQAQIERMRSKN